MSIDEMTERGTTLSEAKRALLAKLMRGGVKTDALAVDSIRPRADAGPAPLAGAQQRLWFMHQMEPGGNAFNIPVLLRLRGPLDAGALERALAEVIRRHHALRTVFPVRGGEPVQEVRFVPARVIEIEDLSSVPAGEREAVARRRMDEESEAPFDLAEGPVCRGRLIRVEAEDHLLVITLHHIVSDGWSTGVLQRELAALYGAFTRGEPSPLPELGIQYGDYAAWNCARLEGPEVARQVEYWRRKLAGAPALLELPTDRPRPAVRDSHGAVHRVRIPIDVWSRMGEIARANGATPFMALAAAWGVLLHRWSGQDEVVLGTTLAGRTRPETEPLIGFFIQTLPLRVDLSGDPAFLRLLKRVRETMLQAYANQEVPFDRLVDELKVGRSLSHAPVFQTIVSLQNASGDAPEFPGLRAEPVVGEVRHAENDILLYTQEDERGIDAMLQYDTDLFDASTVARIATHLLTLARGIAADPESRIHALPMLDDAERHRVLHAWNDTGADPAPALGHAAFEAQVRRTPDAVGTIAGEERTTYVELDRRANQLAHHLRARGVRAETRVAICLERGTDLVVALLGVLKSGGAYVPLDPVYPPARLAHLLNDSAAPVLVTAGGAADGLPPHSAAIVDMDRDAEEIRRHPGERPWIETRPENTAYVYYTSGSTGRPKGVLVQHFALSAYVGWAAEEYAVPGGSRGAVLHTSIAFDLTLTSLWPPLVRGEAVYLLHPRATVEDLAESLRGGRAMVKLTPSHLRGMIEHLRYAPPVEGTIVFVSGGEELPAKVAADTRRAFPGGRIVNEYGPTENTVGCTIHWVGEADERAGGVPAGRPVPATTVYVVGRGMHPAPVGVVGELMLGGVQLALGYLGRPALTAERWVPDPFSGRPGARLYHSGDRVRWRADGVLEFLGRGDDQVKIRGFRIEPGEVEAALLALPAVSQAAVIVREDAPGERRLVAYVVPIGPFNPAELREALGKTLPEHMVPAAIVPLDALPLTPNAKLDRKALPAPESLAGPAREVVPPRTPAEHTIAAIWREALGVEEVGVEDNFFELGGHSLLLARVHAGIREAFTREVRLVDLFRHTTIAGQAAFVTEAEDAPAAPVRAPARADARRDAVNQGALRRGRR